MARGYFVGVTNGLCEHSRARRILRFFASTSRNKKFAWRACKQLHLGSTSERALVSILRANRAKVKFCEQLKILMDHSSPLFVIYRFFCVR